MFEINKLTQTGRSVGRYNRFDKPDQVPKHLPEIASETTASLCESTIALPFGSKQPADHVNREVCYQATGRMPATGQEHQFAHSVCSPSRVSRLSPLLSDRPRWSSGSLRSCPVNDVLRQGEWTQP